MTFSQSVDWISPIGGNLAYFAKNVTLIGDFIRSLQITPSQVTINAGMLETPKTTVAHVAPEVALTSKAVIDLGIRGGIRVAHLHFNDKIYLLNEKQWAEFSHGVIADCKAKLEIVGQIDFQEAIVLANVAQGLTHS